MARQDPVERATRGESIHEVTDWEPRSALDRIAVACHAGALRGSKVAIVVASVVITALVFGVTGLDLVTDPFVGAMVGLSVLPAVALAAFLKRADVTTGEPIGLLVATFVLAVLFAGFALLINSVTYVPLVVTLAPTSEVLAFGAYFFLVVGPVEESVKLLAVRVFAYTDDRFDSVIDGAVYGAVAGLGFATIENALYITDVAVASGGLAATGSEPIERITRIRALAGPGHVLYSAIAGYYLGLAKFNRDRAGPIVIKGLLVAALFHGAYNVTVGTGAERLAATGLLSQFWSIFVTVVAFQSVVGYYLYRKLDRYRRAFHANDAGDPGRQFTPELTEFDP